MGVRFWVGQWHPGQNRQSLNCDSESIFPRQAVLSVVHHREPPLDSREVHYIAPLVPGSLSPPLQGSFQTAAQTHLPRNPLGKVEEGRVNYQVGCVERLEKRVLAG
jgi:hypothetical protein